MKEIKRILAVIVACCFFTACSQQAKDRDIKADIATKAQKEISFAGVNYIVTEGVVQLSGICPSQKAKDKVEATIKKIAGVKDVVSSIAIGPVVLDSDPLLKQSVDSVLKKYSKATAEINNNNVVLLGQ